MKENARSVGAARVEQGEELLPGGPCSTNMTGVEGGEKGPPSMPSVKNREEGRAEAFKSWSSITICKFRV